MHDNILVARIDKICWSVCITINNHKYTNKQMRKDYRDTIRYFGHTECLLNHNYNHDTKTFYYLSKATNYLLK